MTQPEEAQRRAPHWSAYWTNWLEGKRRNYEGRKFVDAIMKARAGMIAWYEQPATARLESKIGDAGVRLDDIMDTWQDQARQGGIDAFHQVLTMEPRGRFGHVWSGRVWYADRQGRRYDRVPRQGSAAGDRTGVKGS
jgi:hypothetical protein